MKLSKVSYVDLNSRQKENFNFQKVASVLADYGFSCMWLNDDWQGADFIANHVDGKTMLRVQLKGRLTINKKYVGKNIYIAFRHNEETYLYPHDIMMEKIFLELPSTEKRQSWDVDGGFSWPNPAPKLLQGFLQIYKI